MIIEDMPLEDYLKHPALNSSKIKLMRKTPADFKAGLEEESESSRSTILGSAVHTLLLEPQAFESRYALLTEDFGDKRIGDNKKRWDAFKRENQGKTVLEKKEAQFLAKLKEKIRQNTRLRLLLASGRTEVTGIVQTDELALKARADLLPTEMIWDVKTTSEGMDDISLYRTIKKYAYDLQGAHYVRVFNLLLGGMIKNFGWIFVDTFSPALHIRLLTMPRIMLEKAKEEHQKLIMEIGNCMRTGIWSGYPNECKELEMPYWAEELK